MIITRTPFRVSFMGGGSDFRDFYNKNGYGAVVSAAIDRYMYIVIHPYFHDKIRIKYSKTEDVERLADINHPLVRECLKKVEVEKGIEIASFADVPAGTGLGSSSAFTVGLLHALYVYKGKSVSKEKLAQEACEIEIDILGEPIGKQDQYASAYGNINYFKFKKDETVEVCPIPVKQEVEDKLKRDFCLYYTGRMRQARDILIEQKNNIADRDKFVVLRKMLGLTQELKEIFQKEEIDRIGSFLHRGWLYKKELAEGISNSGVDEFYNKSLQYGAVGGKLLGAGGGGFLLLYSLDHASLKKKLGCKTLPFNIDKEGTKILFNG
ncbi:MAG: GHMP kinase [Candidatus Omnitrophica bacterium]|nr:GHMP kinase [Candidatus Omnitrophota bacterium]